MNLLPRSLCLFLVVALLASCQSHPQAPVEATQTSPSSTVVVTLALPEISPTPVNTSQALILATKTPTPDARIIDIPTWTTWTPQARLGISEAKAKVEEMLQTKTECKLPCWWGIEPGKTQFVNALDSLAPMTTNIAVKGASNSPSLIAELSFPVSEKISTTDLEQYFVVKNGIVQEMEVETGSVDRFEFKNILRDYGPPQEIWLYGLLEGSSSFFEIFLYYPEKGILSYFDLKGISKGDVVQLCLLNVPASLHILWEPSTKYSFKDFIGQTKRFSEMKEERFLFSIDEVTGWSPQEFTAQFSGSNPKQCFDNPKSQWPSR